VGEDTQSEQTTKADLVLIIDDDQTSRLLMATTLAAAGMETLQASSGREALCLIDEVHFGAVLLDIRMPEMSGLEVLARLRARRETRTLPVILVSGEAEVSDRVGGLQAGADDYVVKPFKSAELVARVQAQLRERAAWGEVIEDHLHKRASVASALGQVIPETTPEATADAICQQLRSAGQGSGAAVLAFVGEGVVIPLAVSGLVAWNMEAGTPLPRSVGYYLAAKAEEGPWIEDLGQDPAAALSSRPAPEIDTLACAPLYRGGRPGGLLVLGASPSLGQASAMQRSMLLSEAIDYAAIAGSRLGAALHHRSENSRRRVAIELVIDAGGFFPVFQPIVDLSDERVVGYEALTRFTDGANPAVRFAEAAAVGVGLDLELATMHAALQASLALPSDHFVSLNVSPELILAEGGGLLRVHPRPVVLELTEHEPVEDYEALRRALDVLVPPHQASVDDAGSGFASLRHVLAISPRFVKLDRSWVAQIEDDPARQALVAGLSHFATTTGSRLIAEGIETEAEMMALRVLNVGMGQGYLFGRPLPVDPSGLPSQLTTRPAA
jgi:EAL domain-containing protein (putative c-di-GMP-specific phosphodiesterase class I)/DNA-binding response OmpR family regulator